MRMLEYQGKELLRKFGIPTPEEKVVDCVQGALDCVAELGFPAVVKAQVLAGGRGKAGGVKVVTDASALKTAAADILGLVIKTETCREILVAKASSIAKEFYMGVTIDAAMGKAVLIFSTEGGVDIETVAKNTPDKVRTLPLSALQPVYRHEVLEELRLGGLSGDLLPKAATVAMQLIKAFFAFDCTTLEINPLAVLADNSLLALDAKAVIDDSALKRQAMVQTDSVPQSELEIRAQAIGVNYVELDGEVAVIAGGAGLGMASMDIVNFNGKKPACFLDTGGGISSANTAEALRICLATAGVNGVLINIFGGINNCEEVAKGICTVVDADKPKAHIVVKMRGHSQDQGWALLEERNIPVIKHGTTEDAVRALVSLLNGGGK